MVASWSWVDHGHVITVKYHATRLWPNFKGAAGSQGNVFMPDAVFCRKCGAKRETA